MDIGDIIKRSWKIVWNHRFLWILGLIGGGMTSSPASMVSWMTDYLPNAASESKINFPASIKQALGLGTAYAQSSNSLDQSTTVAGILITIGLAAILIYLGLTFRGGLITAVSKLNRRSKLDFWQAVKLGRTYFWKLLGLSIYIALLGVLPAAVGFTITMVIFVLKLPLLGIIVALGLLIVWFLFILLLSVIAEYSTREIVLNKANVIESVPRTLRLIRKNLGSSLLIWIVAIGLSFVVWIGLVIILVALFLPLGLVGIGIFSLGPIAGLAYSLLAGFTAIVILCAAAGLGNSFVSAFWTLGYEGLLK